MTASLLSENLSSLDTYMLMVKSNIKQFWVGLKAHGESCNDLIINLFKGYQSASDREFVCYIKQKRDAYNDGGDIQPEALMTLALKYETLLKQDMWNAKLQEQEQIMALTAELRKIKDANLQLARTLSKKQSKSNPMRRKTTRAKARATSPNSNVSTLANGPGRTTLLHKGILRQRNSRALLTLGVQPMRSGVLIPTNSVANAFDLKQKQQRVETAVQTMPIKPTMPRMQMHLPLSCETCKTKNDCSTVFTCSHSDLQHSNCQSSLQGHYGHSLPS
jgi:hypothetical protein